MTKHAELPPDRKAVLKADFALNDPRHMRRGLQAYLSWLKRDDDPARRLCEAAVPAWVVHAEKGDGGLTPHERQVLEACPHVRVVTLPGSVFFLPNEAPKAIAGIGLLTLAFDHLWAEAAVSEVFQDNLASQGVSRKLGYEPDGISRDARGREALVSDRLRLSRSRWENAAHPRMVVDGIDACRHMFDGVG